MDKYEWLTDEVIADGHARFAVWFTRDLVEMADDGTDVFLQGWAPATVVLARYRAWKARQEGAVWCPDCGHGPATDCGCLEEAHALFEEPQTYGARLSAFFADDDHAHRSCLKWQDEKRRHREARAEAVRLVIEDDRKVAGKQAVLDALPDSAMNIQIDLEWFWC